MPSKTSNRPRRKPSPWKAARGCSEQELTALARELAAELQPADRVLLEGPLGAGKTTFARALLTALGVRQPPEGSPTFAIAHEYEAPRGSVIHIDFYRLKSEGEIEEAGIPAYFWERNAIVVCEWLASWPDFARAVEKSGRNWNVQLSFSSEGEADCRDIRVIRPPSAAEY